MTSTHEPQESRRDDDAASGNAAAAPEGDFIDQTVAFWQKRSKRQLTREDGREIIENMTGFFRILQEWDRAERAAQKEAEKRGS
jgi:hypothetical protein